MFQELIEKKAKKAIIKELIEFLQYDGIAFFQMCLDEYGDINCVWNEHGIPHSVHFREGMQIRNWMRRQKYFTRRQTGQHYYDDSYIYFLKLALQTCNQGNKKNANQTRRKT